MLINLSKQMNYRLLLFTFFTISTVFSQQAYYDDVNLTLSGMALKSELSNKIIATHTNNLSYAEVWNALKITDLVPGSATDVYLVYGYNDVDGDVTTDLTRDKNSNGGSVGDWNREHVYPKSLGIPDLGTSGPGADAHMLRSSDVQRNGMRGNMKFVDGAGFSQSISGGWYPGDEWKGDMARIIMYMYLRYESRCLPINTGVGTSVSIDPDMIDLFLEWNAEDPVSSYEEVRNDYLGTTSNQFGQGNRNPFIDNPYLATKIWGGTAAEDIWGIYASVAESDLNNSIAVYPNPVDDILTIELDEELNLESVSIYSLFGKLIYSELSMASKEHNVSYLESGVYMIEVVTNSGTAFKKIIVN
ncbi:MAG: endonuclease [Flavobacteriales bacterium]|nr:endonuclease [Flavobacteriales bacterium]